MALDIIGSVSFIRLSGDVQAKGYEMAEITRQGVNGRAFRLLGQRVPIVQLQGVADVAAESTGDTLVATYHGMRGTVQAVTLHGQSRGNFLILEVQVTDRRTGKLAVGGLANGVHLIRSTWTLTAAGV